MRSPRPRTLHPRVALAALALVTLALVARAQDPRPPRVGTPPQPAGAGGPGRVSDEDRDSDGPFRMNQVEKRPVITFKPEPAFTEEARENDVYGVVRLRAVLSSKGEVTNISVVKGLPDGLTRNAIDAAKQIRFTPARRYGHAVSTYVALEYDFTLADEDADKKVLILEQPQPAYTDEARKNRVSGRVVLSALFHRDGTVSSPTVVEALPDGLTQKAVEALSNIKFAPAELGGRKLTVSRKVVYVFPPGAPAKQ